MSALKALARFLGPYRKWVIWAPLLMLLEVTFDLLQPRLMQHIIDDGIARQSFPVVRTTALLMLAAALSGIGTGMGCTVAATIAAQGFGADLRQALFERIQKLSFGNLDELSTGSLISRLTNDVTQVQEIVAMLLRMMIRAPLLLVGSVVMAMLTSPRLALIYVPLVPIVLVMLTWLTKRMYPLYQTVQGKLDTLNSVVQENLSGVRVVKAFARSRREIDRFGRANDDLMDVGFEAARIGALTMPVMMTAMNMGVVAALWFGGHQVASGQLAVGKIIAFVNYLMQTLMSLMFVSMLVARLSRSAASGTRIVEVLQADPMIAEPGEGRLPGHGAGQVEFRNVSFRYAGDDADPVLRSVSFVAGPGTRTVILGATGAGKSTLVNLVPRFYDVTEGEVLLDGVDVRRIDTAALRRSVAVALQESILFTGTVRDNIRYGRPDATDGEVEEAAQAAQAHGFISALAEGYETMVGRRGANLSGGQKQRIAIARALVMDPSVLILDDSTSAVDVGTEARIREALAQRKVQPTRIVVAQRVSSAQGADQILVLDDGEIAARGTHEELMEASPIYREIYESQAGQAVVANGEA